MKVEHARLDDPDVRALIAYHQQDMYRMSPPGTSWALDLTGLSGPETTVLGAWDGAALLGIGALKRLDSDTVELKSMRTLPDHLGKGVAKAILEELLLICQSEGYTRVSLETGTSDEFVPAITLYQQRGFVRGEAFSNYENGPHNQCYHLDLADQRSSKAG